jgi:hypothetical protein
LSFGFPHSTRLPREARKNSLRSNSLRAPFSLTLTAFGGDKWGEKSNHIKPTNSQQKLIPFRINSYHYSNTVEPSAILKDGGSPKLANATWNIIQQITEYAVRRTPLKSHFCLLFGAEQKVRRLPGRNPAVLILNLIVLFICDQLLSDK